MTLTAKYFGGDVPVLPGDYVETTIWWRRRRGRVVYVPFVSPLNRYMDYDGMFMVGFQIDNGPFVGAALDPDNGYLKKKNRFIARGEPVQMLDPDTDPFGEDEERDGET